MILNGEVESADWQAVRQTKNYQTNAGVTDVSSGDMRCYQMAGGKATLTVPVGSKLGFQAAASVSHFGPLQFYMARVPDSANINTWDAAGNVWFKIAKIDAVKGPNGYDSSVATWPTYGRSSLEYSKSRITEADTYIPNRR
jgi:hypothetical protein